MGRAARALENTTQSHLSAPQTAWVTLQSFLSPPCEQSHVDPWGGAGAWHPLKTGPFSQEQKSGWGATEAL